MQKVLTPEEQFAATDFTDKAQIIKLFPTYVQEQLAAKKNLSKSINIEGFTLKTPYGDKILLKDVDLIIESGKRQCLYGANSTGKTLLFHNMSTGKIKDFPKHIHVHHCEELEGEYLKDTVLNTVVNAHPYRRILVKIIEQIEKLLAAEPAPAEDVKEKLKDNLNYANFQFKTIGGPTTVDRAQKMLRVLGFDEIGQAKLVSALSGGLRMRVALCMAFMIDADLLLLDEPTNHLDFPSVLWLENRLRGYKGAFFMVSHDRELLNNVCTAVAVIEEQTIKYYSCGFKEFEKKKAAEDKKKYEDIEKFLNANRNVDPSTFLGKQRADKKQWADNYHQRQVALAGKFTFPDPTPLDNLVKDADGNLPTPENISLINLQNVRFSYDASTGNWIFNDPISFNVTASTRCGVMGPNGAGKSTFLKLLTAKLIPNEGTVTPHPNYTLAYFGQHSTAELDLETTAAEFMGKSFPDEQAGTLRNHLAKTSIVGAVQDTRMKQLSYSQRSCIVFAKLTFKCPHLLIMDEPTNFLDLESVDSLITACNKYPGALLLVSHNRDFLRKCAKGYLSIVPGSFNLYDNLKDAERGTYTFIAEMEEGGSGFGKDALKNNPGGGTVAASQKTGGTATIGGAKPAGGLVIGASGAKPAAAAAAKPAAVTYAVGEKVQALWTDGKWYAGQVKKVNPDGKYSVLYTQYGNTANLTTASMKKAEAAPAKAAPGAPAAGAKAPVAAKK